MVAGSTQKLDRSVVFFPLLKAIQPRYEGAQFRLWAGEAVAVAKLMTLVLETGPMAPVELRWPDALSRLTGGNPQTANIQALLTGAFFGELVHDAAMFGFTALTTFTGEKFGSLDEMGNYASQVAASLSGQGEPLDLIHAYLPLVLGGIAINAQVVMPGEDLKETMALYDKARNQRASAANEDNQFIFDLAEKLIAL